MKYPVIYYEDLLAKRRWNAGTAKAQMKARMQWAICLRQTSKENFEAKHPHLQWKETLTRLSLLKQINFFFHERSFRSPVGSAEAIINCFKLNFPSNLGFVSLLKRGLEAN